MLTKVPASAWGRRGPRCRRLQQHITNSRAGQVYRSRARTQSAVCPQRWRSPPKAEVVHAVSVATQAHRVCQAEQQTMTPWTSRLHTTFLLFPHEHRPGVETRYTFFACPQLDARAEMATEASQNVLGFRGARPIHRCQGGLSFHRSKTRKVSGKTTSLRRMQCSALYRNASATKKQIQ